MSDTRESTAKLIAAESFESRLRRSMEQAVKIADGTMPPASIKTMERPVVGSKPVTSKQRRNYTARELAEMAANAKEGIPPAGSVADGEIRNAELSGDFERARALREEVKERAPDLARMARAQAKAERRAKRRT